MWSRMPGIPPARSRARCCRPAAWDSSGHNPVTLVRKSNATTGSVDLRSLLRWLQSAGYSTQTGVNQIDFGFELCSTSGQAETFTVTGYTLDATCVSGASC